MPDTEPIALFKDPDNLIADLNSCGKFQISDNLAKIAIAWIAKILSHEDVALDKDGNPREARPRERMAAIKLLASLESVNLRERVLIAELKGLTASLKIDHRMALDVDQLYRDTGIIDVDPIQKRLDQERHSGPVGGKGLAGGNGNGNGRK